MKHKTIKWCSTLMADIRMRFWWWIGLSANNFFFLRFRFIRIDLWMNHFQYRRLSFKCEKLTFRSFLSYQIYFWTINFARFGFDTLIISSVQSKVIKCNGNWLINQTIHFIVCVSFQWICFHLQNCMQTTKTFSVEPKKKQTREKYEKNNNFLSVVKLSAWNDSSREFFFR